MSKLGLARIAAETAALRLFSRKAALKHVVESLTALPGIPAKAGQLLSMREGFDVESAPEGEPVLSNEDVLRLLHQETPELARDLRTLDPDPQVASLSQVHRGTLKDGRIVAVKIQFPGIPGEIDQQLKNVLSLFDKYGPARSMPWDSRPFEQSFQEGLLRELDYRIEAAQQKRFALRMGPVAGLVVPRVLDRYSTDRVLVQEYVASLGLSKLTSSPEALRQSIAKRLAESFLSGLFEHGILQADLHPGNWGYSPEKDAVVMYDFGAIVELEPAHIEALRDLCALTPSDSRLAHLAIYGRLGFDALKMAQLADLLPELTAILTEPLAGVGYWNPAHWRAAERIRSLLGERAWQFRLAGPPWFLSLLRSCKGYLHALTRLDARIDLSMLYLSALPCRKVLRPPASHALVPSRESKGNHGVHLKIEVLEKGEQIVYLELPAASAANLAQLIPPAAMQKIEDPERVLTDLSDRARRSDFAPQELFSGQIESRTYRIWLE